MRNMILEDITKRYMKKRAALALLGLMLIIFTMLTGCGKEESSLAYREVESVKQIIDHINEIEKGAKASGKAEKSAAVEETKTSDEPSSEGEAANEEESGTLEEASAGDTGEDASSLANEEEAPEKLIFRDVFEVEYETVINPNIAKKTYDDQAFIKDGDIMRYTDGPYSLGIDVSHHQGDIDWNAVKAAGFDFAILRIGYRGYAQEGTLNADKKFEEYYTKAKEAGLKVGVYFFAQAVNEEEAREEAEFVLGILNGRSLELPVVYDPESILDDEARTDDVSGQQFTANTAVFCRLIEEGGYSPMIYANMLWEAFELDLEKLADYPIWYADYEDKPHTPYAFKIWQYTNEASVPGVSGVCDIDIMLE